MTKEEILKIIEQNKDILTPENLHGILKDIDLFTELEWQGIANYLKMTHELIQVNHKFLRKENEVYEDMASKLDAVNDKMKKGVRKIAQAREKSEEDGNKAQLDQIISNL